MTIEETAPLSETKFSFDHVHLLSKDPQATARWYVEMLGAELVADTVARGAPQIFLLLGGANIVVRGRRPGEDPTERKPFRPFADFSSHDNWGCDHFGFLYAGDLAALCAELEAKGVAISVPLKTGVGGRRLCYVAAPDDVNIEIMER